MGDVFDSYTNNTVLKHVPYKIDYIATSLPKFSRQASRGMSFKFVVAVVVVLLLLIIIIIIIIVTHYKLTSPDSTFSTKLMVSLQMAHLIQ